MSKALGRGLGALLNDDNEDEVDINKVVEGATVIEVLIDEISANPNQPRKEFAEDKLLELSQSIKEKGVIQPILVEKGNKPNSYIIIAGERRYRASKIAGLKKIPVIVKAFTEEEVLEIALIENIQREDLNPVEEAKAYQHLMKSFDLSQEDIAKRVGKNRSTIANSLRLLKLPEDMLTALSQGIISAGHARSLLSVVNPADQRILYKRVVDNSLNVRDTESMSSALNNGNRPSSSSNSVKSTAKSKSPDIQDMEQRFIDLLGTKVSLKGTVRKGKIEISYFSMDDLERILDIISK
ncbi:ParB/RepB/Spo0J family partition protein [Spirochaeta cellobiosiphila]|uniref:ParB/RepB/Spo0J family partition protein n=1 Tax=Spirochaeta cellobiosiphila TaxID=504483 RepID=UPI00040B9CC5|nr:ParB/RepB/Spo0J family partition protein [Spirochaeta cellobiosiphila]